MAKWILEHTEFNVVLWSHPSIKAQVLTDFLIECTIPNEEPIKANPRWRNLLRANRCYMFMTLPMPMARARLILVNLEGGII